MIDNIADTVQTVITIGVGLSLLAGFLVVLSYLFVLWYRWRDREKKSLEFVLLQITVPHDNEIKIDAMEQIFSSLSSIYKGPKFKWLAPLHTQKQISLEIVATSEDIRFYISCHKLNHRKI